ncbi:MAG: CHASE2 domain-containing protein [Desulfobacteraceae bacterium]|nr:MAG: CHASE2 domain-containing protein [Desulfobacteraceae bacterium]
MKLSVNRTDLLITALIAVFYVFLSFRAFPFLEGMERIVYSVQMRLDLPRSMGENKIAIVNIDEKSLSQLGPWPWPRYLIAEMIRILKTNGAKLIGLDLIFSHKEQNQGLDEVKRLHEAISEQQKADDKKTSYTWILEKLKRIEENLDNDKKLSQTVKESGNIILPVVGKFGQYDTELVIPDDSFIDENSLKPGNVGKRLEKYVSVNQLTTPFPELSNNTRGIGHINLPPDEVMAGQVHLPFINYRGHIIPSMPMRLALDYLNKYPEQVIVQSNGIRLDKQIIPTTKGEIFLKYKGGRKSFPYYSFVDILKVKKVPAVFDGKIVLIGFTAKEGGISINTPVDPKMPRVELTANIIEGFMNGRYLKRPGTLIYLEILLILLLGFFSCFFLPRLSYFPRIGVLGAMIFGVFLTGLTFFMVLNVWFKIVYICLSLVTIYLVFWVKEIAIRQKSLATYSKESIETNRMLGLSLQSQGLLDLAFEKFRKCPLDDAMKDVLYNLALDFERKRMITKAISVYEYMVHEGGAFRDLDARIPKLRKFAGELPLGKHSGKDDGKLLVSDDLETKPTVGRYEILGELGQGAMGVVYKGRDPKINRLVAIKTIRFSDDFEEQQAKEVKERFFKEAELAGRLSHPSIISIHDVGEDYELTYMAMELLEGRDLEDFCQQETLLPLRKALDIIAETADALDYAHTQGVIHRDIKPGNIMLLKNGHIKVTDFGIAKAVSSSQTRTGIILGTPNYMSPEQINGMEIDGRSDIFSLGIVFFQLLTGRLPFGGKTLTELFYQITQAKHPSPRDINPKVIRPCEQLVDKALAKDPGQRFRRASDFAKYLRVLGEKIDRFRAQKGKIVKG